MDLGAIVTTVREAQPSVKRGALLVVVLVLLNIFVGILIVLIGNRYPMLSGLAVLAWGFGFRHAMDADHIAAIDNVTRRLLYRGKHAVGVGAYFSLGHSTVVLLLTLAIVFFAPFAGENLDSWKAIGTVVGIVVSSTFLLLIGVMNIGVLVRLLGAWRDIRTGKSNTYHGHMHLGGPIEKLFRPLTKLVDHSYKMYLIGFLFGLGLDTAMEVGLLALATLTTSNVPPVALFILPFTFMAGMILLDTINALCMLGIYSWGVFDDKRRILFNINITALSLLSALTVGGVVGIKLIAEYMGLSGGFFSFVERVSIEHLGYWIAGFFVLSWFVAIIGLRPREGAVLQ